MKKLINNFHTDEFYSNLYKNAYNHNKWNDHVLRINISSVLLKNWIKKNSLQSIGDLSTGDGHLPLSCKELIKTFYLSDFCEQSVKNLRMIEGVNIIDSGKIQDNLNNIPLVDMFICSETLEHLEDPEIVLNKIAQKSRFVFISTPVNEEIKKSHNQEHYWSWNTEDVKKMLLSANFKPLICNLLDLQYLGEIYYCFQMWIAKSSL